MQHITKLLSRSSNQFRITIAKFYPCQQSLTFSGQIVHAFFFTPLLFKFFFILFFKFSTRYSNFSIDCLSCSNSPDEVFFRIGNIKPRLCYSSLMQRFALIRPLPPFLLIMYNLSTSLFGCNFPYIVIVFLDFLPTYFNSLSFYSSIPAPYLNTTTAHAFIAVNLFFLCSFYGLIEAFTYIPLLFFLSSHSS